MIIYKTCFNKIDINKYYYHQINIFIKLFISQFNKFKEKLSLYSNGKDVTGQYIKYFCKNTRYFTNGGFAKLLTGTDNIYKKGKSIIEILQIYMKMI